MTSYDSHHTLAAWVGQQFVEHSTKISLYIQILKHVTGYDSHHTLAAWMGQQFVEDSTKISLYLIYVLASDMYIIKHNQSVYALLLAGKSLSS